MKIVKPTFESLLAETDTIYVRYESINGEIALVAGGIDKNGRWLEFPLLLPGHTTLTDVERGLEVVEYITKEKGKQWRIEDCYYSLIRKLCTNLN